MTIAHQARSIFDLYMLYVHFNFFAVLRKRDKTYVYYDWLLHAKGESATCQEWMTRKLEVETGQARPNFILNRPGLYLHFLAWAWPVACYRLFFRPKPGLALSLFIEPDTFSSLFPSFPTLYSKHEIIKICFYTINKIEARNIKNQNQITNKNK